MIARHDVTESQLVWAAASSSAFTLNRIVSHPKTPLDNVRSIRDEPASLEGKVWLRPHDVAEGVITGRRTGKSMLVGQGSDRPHEYRSMRPCFDISLPNARHSSFNPYPLLGCG